MLPEPSRPPPRPGRMLDSFCEPEEGECEAPIEEDREVACESPREEDGPEIELERIYVWCKTCKDMLYSGKIKKKGEYSEIRILPCENCRKKGLASERAEGYTAGYDDGFAYGKDAEEVAI